MYNRLKYTNISLFTNIEKRTSSKLFQKPVKKFLLPRMTTPDSYRRVIFRMNQILKLSNF